MSDVDKRIVQMDFDNKKFEKNVKQSTESVNNLKKTLNFDGVSNSIDQVSLKIKSFEIMTTTALVNITNQVVNLGIRMVKSLSVDNISAGWAKYGQKTTSVATMMAQNFKVAGREITDVSERMSIVTDQLERLSWFSDETSYTFTDMVDNVGKFIAAGQDLDVSVKAMEGIATWAALSGQNAATASRAMYQLAQAMGKGKIQLIDYKSIQNANMDTVEFRQTILEAAVALGELTKEGDKFVTKTGKKFTQNQFAEELSSGWFTSKVLVEGLSKYSAAVDQIYELANKEGITASEVIEKYGDTLDTFGLKAFKAAQEARTFADVLNSVRDAVSSKWMETAETIFGNKDEAVELWTELANALYEVFAEAGNFRNEILKVWKALGGREDLFKRGGPDQGAFWNIYDAIINLKKLIKSAWNTIFPISQMEDESDQAREIGSNLKTLTKSFQAFTKKLEMSEVTSLRLHKIFEGLFSILKFGIQVLKAIRYVVDPIFEIIKQLSSIIIDKLIYSISKLEIDANGIMQFTDKIGESLTNIFEPLLDLLRGTDILSNFSNYFRSFVDTSNDQIFDLGNVFEKMFAIVTKLFKIIASIPSLINSLSKKITGNDIVTNLYLLFNGILDIINNFVNNKKSDISKGNNILSPLEYFLDGLCTLLSGILSVSRLALMLLGKAFSAIGSILSKVGELFIGIIQGTSNISKLKLTFIIIGGIILGILIVILNTVKNIGWMITALKNPFAVIADSVSGLIDKLSLKMMADAVKTFATSVLLIAASLLIISSISKENLLRSLFTLTIIVGVLAGVLFLMIKMSDLIEKSSKNIFQLSKKSAMLRSLYYAMSVISSSFLKIAVAFYIVGKLSESQMENGFNLMTAIILYQFILIKILSNTKVDAKKIFPTMKQLIGISILLLAFAKTIKVISSIDWSSGLYSVIYISVFLAAFTGAMISLNKIPKSKSTNKILREFISMSILLLAFGESMAMLSTVPWQSILTATLGLTAVLLSVLGLEAGLTAIGKSGVDILKDMAGISGGVILLAGSLLILATSFQIFSNIGWETIGKGAVVVGGALILLATIAGLLSRSKVETTLLALSGSMALVGVGMLTAAMAIQILINVLGTIAQMSSTSIQAVSENLNMLAQILSTALLVGLQSLFDNLNTLLPSMFETISIVIDGILSLISEKVPMIVETLLSIVDKFLVSLDEHAESIFDSIMSILNKLLTSLDNNAESISNKLVDILLKIIKTAGNRADDIIAGILSFAIDLIKGLLKNEQLLKELVSNLLKFIMSAIIGIAQNIVGLAGAIAKVLLILLSAALQIVTASLGGLASLMLEFITAFLLVLVHTVIGMQRIIYQTFKTIVFNVIDILNKVLMDVGPMLAVMLKTGFNSLLAGILEAIAILIKDIPVVNLLYDPIHNAAENMKAGVKNTMDEYADIMRGDNVISALKQANSNITSTVKKSMSAMKDTTTDVMNDINSAMTDSMSKLGDTMTDLAKQATNGFNMTLNDGIDEAKQTGVDLGNATAEGIASVKSLDIHSPSRKMAKLGIYAVQGLINGIDENKDEVVDTMTSMVSNAVNAAQDTIENQNGDDLTIKVGMDISGVEAQSKKITDIMTGINKVDTTVYGKNALYASRSTRKYNSEQSVTNTDNSSNVTYNNVFNVSSTDPQRSADEIDKVLNRQAIKARLARGAI